MSVRIRSALVACLLLGVLLASPIAQAFARSTAAAWLIPRPARTVIVVNTTADDFTPGNGTCSLREAIYAASHDVATDACPAGGADDTVRLAAQTYELARPAPDGEPYSAAVDDLDISGSLRLEGAPGAMIKYAPPSEDDWWFREHLLEIHSGQVTIQDIALHPERARTLVFNRGDLTMRRVMIDGGHHENIDYQTTVSNHGRLTIEGSTFTRIYHSTVIHNHAAGQLLLSDSQIRDTEIPYRREGHVLTNDLGGVTTIYSSTIARNVAFDSYGAPIANQGHLTLNSISMTLNYLGTVTSTGVLTVTDSRFTDNGIWDEYRGTGGGIYVAGGSATVERSILKDNFGDPGITVVAGASATVRDTEIDEGGIRNLGSIAIIGSEIHDTEGFNVAVYNNGAMSVADSRIHHNRPIGFRGEGFGGGGIVNDANGRLSVLRTRIDNNIARNGSGIRNAGSAVLRESLLDDNRALAMEAAFGGRPISGGDGGAIYNTGIFTITNSSLISNTSDFTGGAVFAAGGRISLDSSTLAFNVADGPNTLDPEYDQAGDGGGIFARPGAEVVLRNTLVGGNRDLSGGGNNLFGAFASAGFNLIQTADGYALAGDQTGNQIGVNPLLGALADHGGPTRTVDLLPGSPAIDAGSPGCPPTDQRGMPRPRDGDGDGAAQCDIGAYEHAPGDQIPTATPTAAPTATSIAPTPTATQPPAATSQPTAIASPTTAPNPTTVTGGDHHVYLPLLVR